MRRIRLGNTEVDGEATGPDGQRIAIEIKTPRDDLARGIGQLAILERVKGLRRRLAKH